MDDCAVLLKCILPELSLLSTTDACNFPASASRLLSLCHFGLSIPLLQANHSVATMAPAAPDWPAPYLENISDNEEVYSARLLARF